MTDSSKSPTPTSIDSAACRKAAQALAERTEWTDSEFDAVVVKFGLKGDEEELIALLLERGWVHLSGYGVTRISEEECTKDGPTRFRKIAPCQCERCEEVV